MKCLTVKQPWAELIASGAKSIELRTWHLKYRGPLVIIAAAKRSPAHPDVDGARSRAVALVELVEVRPAQPFDAERARCEPAPGEYAWELRLVRRLEVDVYVKGQLSIYSPPADLAKALNKMGIQTEPCTCRPGQSCNRCGLAVNGALRIWSTP